MEALKQIVKIPDNYEIRIKIPHYIPKNEEVEVILIFRKKPTTFNQKVSELREALGDTLFLNDLRDISEDFKIVDSEGWKENNAI